MQKILSAIIVALSLLVGENHGKTSKGTCGWASPANPVTGFDYSILSGETFYVYAHDSSVKSDTSCMKFEFASSTKATFV